MAIAAVVAYHARPSLLPGGYVGVDVFFVVSGFVITSMLWRELDERGSISLRRFYAARMRRLLPASTLVIAATVIASALLLSPLAVPAVERDALACAAYVANYRFAAEASNYLTASAPLSPLQHYWSLGVEEQFYLCWPLLLLGASLAWRRAHRPSRRTAAAVVAVLAVVSFASCWHLTATNEPWAFYALPPRAFELATGALVALVAPRLQRLAPAALAPAGWIGLALVVAATVSFGPSTPFPGSAALAPVLGTAAVLAAGCVPSAFGAGVFLERRPLQWLGGISYTLYLWHYPVLVLAPDLLHRALDPLASCLAVVLAGALAVLTTILVERPLRFSPWLAARRGMSALTGGALSLGAASIAVLVATATPSFAGTAPPRPPLLASAGPLAAEAASGPTGASGAGGARAAGSLQDEALAGEFAGNGLGELTGGTGEGALSATTPPLLAVERAVLSGAAARSLPGGLRPALSRASSDAPVPFFDGCFDSFATTAVNGCDYGDVASSRSVVLFGDSHAMMWFPALEEIALSRHVHLVALAKATCPPLDLEVFSPDLGEWYWQCDDWRQAALQRIEALRPAVVVLGFSREYGLSNDHVEVYGTAWMNGLAEMVRRLRGLGADVVVIGPVPYPPFRVPDCLAQHPEDPTQCSMPDRAPWYDAAGVRAEESVVERAGGSYIDVQRLFCTPAHCLTMIGAIVAYRDDNHISATYAAYLAPVIAAALGAVTRGRF